jgi:hypothetical protein
MVTKSTSIRLTEEEEGVLDAWARYRGAGRARGTSRTEVIGWMLRRVKPPADALGPEATELRQAWAKLNGEKS